MLEASGFDFRNRYPQKILMKLVKSCSLDKSVGAVTYNICLDLYRTFAPLKQSMQTMSLACLELAIRVCDVDLASVKSEHGFDYDRWATTRLEIMGEPKDGLVTISQVLIQNRNSSRPARPLHPSPHGHHRRSRLSAREVYQHTHSTQPGSISRKLSSLHRVG